MRGRISVGLVVVCLGLAGCITSNKNGSKTAAAPRPFDGKPSNQEALPGQLTSASGDNLGPEQVSGLLAGQVIARYNNRGLSHAYIEIKDLDNLKGAEISTPTETDPNGYFIIRRLRKGHHYQLIARVQDEGRQYVGTAVAVPPDPKIIITVSEDLNPPEGQASPTGIPGATPSQPGNSLPPRGPGATMEAPVPLASPPNSNGGGGTPAASAPTPGASPDRIADGGEAVGGFPRAPVANIENPGSGSQLIPPTPPVRPNQPSVNPTSQQSSGNGDSSEVMSDEPTRIPWALMYGRTLKGMALYNLDGSIWDLRRNRQGRVLLLDFWSTNCVPCVRSIPKLCDLQNQYRPHGLEVVGITYDNGPQLDQISRIKALRSRNLVNYQTLLGGGNECPVKELFQIKYFPTLILLDENNMVVWRSNEEGLTDSQLKSLKREIAKQLRVDLPRQP